jgi:hypothetical protein
MKKVNEEIPNNLHDLHDAFKRGETFSFIVPKKRIKRLGMQFRRIHNAEKYFSEKESFGGQFKSAVYALYVAFTGALVSLGHKDIEMSLLIFHTSWRFIAPIEGPNELDELPEGMVKITFRGKLQ